VPPLSANLRPALSDATRTPHRPSIHLQRIIRSPSRRGATEATHQFLVEPSTAGVSGTSLSMVGYVDRIYTLFDGRAMMSRACMIDSIASVCLRRHHLRLLAHIQYTSAIGLEGIVIVFALMRAWTCLENHTRYGKGRRVRNRPFHSIPWFCRAVELLACLRGRTRMHGS
jgi:hypothetical protein